MNKFCYGCGGPVRVVKNVYGHDTATGAEKFNYFYVCQRFEARPWYKKLRHHCVNEGCYCWGME